MHVHAGYSEGGSSWAQHYATCTSSACFVRAQVRQAGAIVVSGNPTWLLGRPPAGGIPPTRAI